MWGQDFLDLLTNPCAAARFAGRGWGARCAWITTMPFSYGRGMAASNCTAPKLREPYDPLHFYHYVDGKIFCGLTVATYALTDVPEGAGGLAVIPGSHKSNFPRSRRHPPFQASLSPRAAGSHEGGGLRDFYPAVDTWHTALAGTGYTTHPLFPVRPRRVALGRPDVFSTAAVPGIQDMEARLTPQQKRLLMPPTADDFRRNR